MFKASLLPSARLFAFAALFVSAITAAPPSRAHAQSGEPAAVSPGPTRSSLSEGDRLALSRPTLRVRRTIRTGATMMALGSTGLVASAVLLRGLDGGSCAGHDPFCENRWARGIGAFTGMAVGSLLLAGGTVTLGVGLAKRNRLRRLSDVALGVGPSHLDLRLTF